MRFLDARDQFWLALYCDTPHRVQTYEMVVEFTDIAKAVWLRALVKDKVPESTDDWLKLFSTDQTNVAAARFYASKLAYPLANKLELVQEAVALDYAPAMAWWCQRYRSNPALLQKAADLDDRDALVQLAGQGGLQYMACYLRAALLGHRGATAEYGCRKYSFGDYRRYEWVGKAGDITYSTYAVRYVNEHVKDDAVVFTIGKYVDEHCDGSLQLVRARRVYLTWCARAKEAARTWMAIGKRLGICLDVRRLMRDLIWAQRRWWL